MERGVIKRAAEIIAQNTACGKPSGGELYCVLALMDDETGGPTASAITPARAEGIEWITFCTGRESNKARRAGQANRAAVCFASDCYNITLTGRVEVVTDEAVKREMWYDGLENHFSGADDPNYCVLRFRTERYNLLVDWKEARGAL